MKQILAMLFNLHTIVRHKYSAPRLNGQSLSSHFLAVKAAWPIIRANLIEIPSLGIEKSGQLTEGRLRGKHCTNIVIIREFLADT